MLPENPTPSFPYQVEDRIGTGSMGVVYRAREPALDRTVAIKTLRRGMLEEEPPEVQREMRQRFLQEARAAARLSHPGITVVHRVAEEGGNPYLVMEWLSGKSLEQAMADEGKFDVPRAARLGVALLETLAAAHDAGVVHRDIKPSNLMLLDDGRLKVTDFGIARVQGHELVKTQAGVVLATPKFASPEQLRGMEVDGRADLFSVGVLLYHLISGRFPFTGESFMDLANAILSREPLALRQVAPEVPAELESVIRIALRKDRRDRFAHALEMAEGLRAVLGTGSGWSVAGTGVAEVEADTQTARITPLLKDMPTSPPLALAATAQAWPSTILGQQDSRALVTRLLERPLHASAFAGAAMIGDVCFLIADGVTLGVIDTRTGATGDAVEEGLPAAAAATLHPLPAQFPEGLVPVLAGVLHAPQVLHADLDSSFINLPALSQKLRQDRFDGVFRLSHGDAWGMVFFVGGEVALSIYSRGWSSVPVEQSWRRWISDHPVRGQVEAKCTHPTAGWYRHAYKDLDFEVEAVGDDGERRSGSSSSRWGQLLGSGKSTAASSGRLKLRLVPKSEAPAYEGCGVHWDRAPAARFVDWALGQLPGWFGERDLFARWKYLAEWLLEVRGATLHHPLERPGGRETDLFDVVTRDAKGKVLHLAHRLANPNAESFQGFLERVMAAKGARKKSGDVGGVFLVAPHFGDDVLAAYEQALATTSSGSWFGVEESFTGYAGFVRMGPRRGFHLMLVQEKADGFEPVLLG
ncbi:MAG: serine/threonine-protein kinase [Acidobacteriota bacterium]